MSLAILGASGKLGFATLSALLDRDLISPKDIICTTSSDSGAKKLDQARQKGVTIKRADWDNAATFESAFRGCSKLFIISSSRIQKDFHDAAEGSGRESDHYVALEAAKNAGVKHVYYTSLAFLNPSKSRVMKAHERTEAWLTENWTGDGRNWTVIREGLYNESWPLYMGHWKVGEDDRTDVPIAGDSRISWTSISDLGLATALVLTAPSAEWAGKTFYLSQSTAHTLTEVASMVAQAIDRPQIRIFLVPREQHEDYYVSQRGMEAPYVKWWAKTYDALNDHECEIKDATLEKLLKSQNVKPTPMEETVRAMCGASTGYTGSFIADGRRADGVSQASRE